MMWGYYGWGALWMGLVMLVFWGGLVVLAVWAVRSLAAPRREPDSALEVLRRRLAAGEISPEEFERTRRTLGA